MNLDERERTVAAIARMGERNWNAHNVAVVREAHGYWAVLDLATHDKLMTGFDSGTFAQDWALSTGVCPVRSDEEALRILETLP